MSKRKSSESTSATSLQKLFDEPDAEPEAPVEKKRKITADPRFIILMTVGKKFPNPPKTEIFRMESKKQPGKFSILVRGEQNAYKLAINQLQEHILNRREADLIFKAAGSDHKDTFNKLNELVTQSWSKIAQLVRCEVIPCVTSTL